MKNLSSVVFVLSTLALSACDPQDKPATDVAPVAAPVAPETPAVVVPAEAVAPAPTVVEVTAEPVAAPAK